MNKRILAVLGSVLLTDNIKLFYSDICYRETVKQFLDIKFDVNIIGRLRPVKNLIDQSLIVHNSIEYIKIPDYSFEKISNIVNYFKILFSKKYHTIIRNQVVISDCVYLEALAFPESIVVAFYAKKYNKKIIYEIRGDVLFNRKYMTIRYGFLGYILLLINKTIFNYIRTNSIGGIFVSTSLKNKYLYQNNHKNLISTDCYIDLSSYNIHPISKKQISFNFLYIGHLEAVKQVDLIIESLYLIKDSFPANWSLSIVGDGPENDKLKSISSELGLQKNIFFWGRINWGPELFNLYLKSDLLLQSSISEGASRVMIEAMCFALPIISTDVGIASDVLLPESIVRKQDKNDYALRILSVISDEELFTSMSNHNLRKSKEISGLHVSQARYNFWEEVANLK
jgi:glycosyltransferase involved in cell wall biosynthesis